MQLQQRGESVDRGGGVLLWLVWLLPPLALVLLLAFVLGTAAGIDMRASVALIATGHGGEVLIAILVVIGWLTAQTAQLLITNWPLVLVGACLAGLVWVLRSA